MDIKPTVSPRDEPWPLGSAQADVRAFHKATDLPVRDFPVRDPKTIDHVTLLLRARLIQEEAGETIKALGCLADMDGEMLCVGTPDLVQIADGIADTIYVLLGTAVSLGISIPPVWREVQRSNMTKIDPKTGKAIKRSDGKILKPATFSPADVASIVLDQVIAGEYEEAVRLRDGADHAAGR